MSRRAASVVLTLAFLTASACQDRQPVGTPAEAPVKRAAENGMCAEHGVPESLCTKCNPSLVPVFQARGDWCEEHGFPESICPVCNPEADFSNVVGEPAPAAKTADVGAIEGRVVRFRTPEIEKQAGLRVTAAIEADSTSDVACSARLEFNADGVADVRAIVPGVVRKIAVKLGDQVARGDRLFDLESTEISDIQATLQNARERVRTAEINLERQRKLKADKLASPREVEVAEQEYAAARASAEASTATLRMAGASRSTASGRYVLRSPIAGTVVRRPAVVGVLATEETSLATVADTSVLWAMCDVAESDAAQITIGQPIRLELGGGRTATGTLSWLAPEVDPRTRTVVARADIPNPDGSLRANQFAQARILTKTTHDAVLVPRAAIQRVEGHDVVFVRSSPGTYLPRVVQRKGDGDGDLVAVTANVAPGDEIVVEGAVLLRTEAMPGSIGAGCCEVGPPGGE